MGGWAVVWAVVWVGGWVGGWVHMCRDWQVSTRAALAGRQLNKLASVKLNGDTPTRLPWTATASSSASTWRSVSSTHPSN